MRRRARTGRRAAEARLAGLVALQCCAKIDFIAAAAAAAELGDALLVLNYVPVLYRDARLRELAQREASVDPTLLDLVPVRVDVAPCDGRNGFSSLQSPLALEGVSRVRVCARR